MDRTQLRAVRLMQLLRHLLHGGEHLRENAEDDPRVAAHRHHASPACNSVAEDLLRVEKIEVRRHFIRRLQRRHQVVPNERRVRVPHHLESRIELQAQLPPSVRRPRGPSGGGGSGGGA